MTEQQNGSNANGPRDSSELTAAQKFKKKLKDKKRQLGRPVSPDLDELMAGNVVEEGESFVLRDMDRTAPFD